MGQKKPWQGYHSKKAESRRVRGQKKAPFQFRKGALFCYEKFAGFSA